MDGIWPEDLLDAYVTLIPKADGDATPLGQRPLCVLRASVRLRHLDSWLRSWLPLSVFSAGGGVVGLWRPGIPLHWTLSRSCLA